MDRLTSTDNFFNYDESEEVAIYDAEQVDGIMEVWRKEATKKM